MLDVDTLNPEQQRAVFATEGPVLVLAGAGSGKTRVVTYRLAYLLQRGVRAQNILSVTFTNKAAFEMKTRGRALVGRSLKGATISTFHALGARILRAHVEAAGLRPGFTISDAADQMGTLRRILRDLRIDDRRFDAKILLQVISKVKNAGVTPEAFRDAGGTLGGAPLPELRDAEYELAAVEVYDAYQRRLLAQNVVDFDDLLLRTLVLLRTDEAVRRALIHRFHYLMVDEYQDTNAAQFELLRILAGERKNLCVVGDDDQSIYGWRGADIGNILRFDHDFPGAQVVKLETNYRSTGNILETANVIIQESKQRHDKRLRSVLGPGEPVQLVEAPDEDREAEMVAERIAGIVGRGVVPKDVAILYRSNTQSRPFELALRTAGVPYRVVGGQELFDKKEIRDVLAYLRLLDNKDDEQSLRRIVNFPPRGIGDSTIERIDGWARERGLSLGEALPKVAEVPGVSARSADHVLAFLAQMDEHRRLLGRRKASTVVRKLIDAVELERVLLDSSDNGTVAARRVENVREIVRQIERYEERLRHVEREPEEDDPIVDDVMADPTLEASLGGFLSDLALGARDEGGGKKKDKDDQIVLSTIHAAKGLEWEWVFLVGIEEDILPHKKTVEAGADLDEERRLAYVAVTRARRNLVATWARTRAKWGQTVERTRSRFFEGLPDDVAVSTSSLAPPRTEAEEKAIAADYIAQIKKKLGM